MFYIYFVAFDCLQFRSVVDMWERVMCEVEVLMLAAPSRLDCVTHSSNCCVYPIKQNFICHLDPVHP